MNGSNSSCFVYAEIDKLILNFIWKWKGPNKAKTILKKNKVVRFTLLDLKTYYKMTVNQECVVLA